MSNRLEAAPVTMAKDGEDAPPKRPLFGFLRGGSEKKKDVVESDFARLRSLQQARSEEASDADRRAQIEATADRQGRIDHLVERFRDRALEVLELETKQQGDVGQCDITVEIDEDLLIHTFTQVAMGDEQGHVHLIDALNGSMQHDLPLHRNWCTALSSSRDGALVASGSLDRTVKVVSTASGEILGDFEFEEPVSALAFSPSGEQLAVGTTAGGLTVHDLHGGQVILESQQEKRVTAVKFSPDGTHLAVGAQGLNGTQPTGRLLRVKDGEVVHVLNHGSVLDAFSFSADGAWLACGGLDPVTLVVPLSADKVEGRSVDVVTGSKVLAMSHVDDLLVSAGRDGWLRMVNFANDERFEVQVDGTMMDLSIAADGLEVGIGYKKGHLEVRSTDDGSVVRRMDLASDMTPISMTLVRGQRLVEGVGEALPQVSDEIKEGGFELGVPYVKAHGDAWQLVLTAAWSWA
jgi:WD40 repeat protein